MVGMHSLGSYNDQTYMDVMVPFPLYCIFGHIATCTVFIHDVDQVPGTSREKDTDRREDVEHERG